MWENKTTRDIMKNKAGKMLEQIESVIEINKKNRNTLLGIGKKIEMLKILRISEMPMFISSPTNYLNGEPCQVELLATDIILLIQTELKHRKAALAEAVKEIEGKING